MLQPISPRGSGEFSTHKGSSFAAPTLTQANSRAVAAIRHRPVQVIIKTSPNKVDNQRDTVQTATQKRAAIRIGQNCKPSLLLGTILTTYSGEV